MTAKRLQTLPLDYMENNDYLDTQQSETLKVSTDKAKSKFDHRRNSNPSTTQMHEKGV